MVGLEPVPSAGHVTSASALHFFAIFSTKFTMRHFLVDIFHFSNIKDIIYFSNKKYSTIFLLSTKITFLLKEAFLKIKQYNVSKMEL